MKLKLTYILSILSAIYLVYFGFCNLETIPSFEFLFTNSIINFLSLFFLIKTKRNFSLKKIVYIFIFFFFGLSPLFQVNNNFYVWGTILTNRETIIVNIVLILILLIFHLFSRNLFFKNFNKISVKNIIFNSNVKEHTFLFSTNSQFILLFFISTLFFIIFYLYNFKIINLLYRSGDSENGFKGGQLLYLVISYFIRPLVFNTFIFLLFCKKKSKFFILLFLFFALLAVFPTGVPRFFAATMYLTLLIIIINLYTKLDISLFFIITIGLVYVFPFLDIFRIFNTNKNISDYIFTLDFMSGNFDAYGMFALAISRGTIVYGKNVLSAILFFIPRSVWPNKQIGSGALLSGQLGLELDNVSMPFFAEGYLAFGFIGILLFVFLLARFVYKVDFLFYYHLYSRNTKSPIVIIMYLNLIFLIFFIMRGDLLSSFAYLIGITLANYTLYKTVKYLS